MRKTAFIVIIILVCSCSDNSYLAEHDIIKYDWLKPFINDQCEYIDGKLNHDLGILTFRYNCENIRQENFNLKDYNDIALSEDWIIIKQSENSSQYSKSTQFYPADPDGVTIQLELDNKLKHILYTVK